MPTIKKRDMLVQVLLMIVTLGFYGFYWFYVTAEELKLLAQDQEAKVGLWTVLLFIPPLGIYSHYKYAELYEKVASDKLNRWILFILGFVFLPAVWFIVQTELNKRAGLALGVGRPVGAS